MNRQKTIQIFLITLAIFCLVSLTFQQRANAQLSTYYLLDLAMPNAVYSSETRDSEQNVILIINRDTAFVHTIMLNDSDKGPTCDGFGPVYPLSGTFNILDWVKGSVNVNGIRVSAVLNPFYEVYNDSNENGYLDIERSSSANSTEAEYILVPQYYQNVTFDDLSIKQGLHFGSKPNSYSWGANFYNVTVGCFNATLDTSTGNNGGEWLANDTFEWINKSYTYSFSSDQWQLKQTITFGTYLNSSNPSITDNNELAIVYYHVIGRVNLDYSPTIKDNSSTAFNTTHTVTTEYLDFTINGSIGRWDMTNTNTNYTNGETEYNNATAISSPIAQSVNVALNFTDSYFYDGKFDVNFTGIKCESRVCFNIWNSSETLTIDPQYNLDVSEIIPLWYALVPDLILQNYDPVDRWIFYSILLAIWGFGCFEINRRRGTEEGTIKIGETAINIGSLLIVIVMVLSTIILLSITEGLGLFIEIRKACGYQI